MNQCTTYVPGKVMLSGEYGVLFGEKALASSLSQGLSISVKKNMGTHKGFEVKSPIWEKPIHVLNSENILAFKNNPFCETVAFAMNFFGLDQGVVSIDSSIEITHGVGTSSAIRLGTLIAFRQIGEKNTEISDLELAKIALQLQRNSQSQASGYDILTQLHGGIVEMLPSSDIKTWPKELFKYPKTSMENLNRFVHIFVGGRGAPTEHVMKKTLSWLEHQNLMAQMLEVTCSLTNAFSELLKNPASEHISSVITHMGKQRALFEPSPCYPSDLSQKLKKINGCDRKWSFKTTGAGGEDALLVFAPAEELEPIITLLAQENWIPMPYHFDTQCTYWEVN